MVTALPKASPIIQKGKQQDAYPILWKRNSATPLHGDGIRSSGDPVLSKNTNELKTGAPGRFDRVHRQNCSGHEIKDLRSA